MADKWREGLGAEGWWCEFSPVLAKSCSCALHRSPLVSAFLVFILLMCRCPEGGVAKRVGGRRRADHPAVVVDAQSFAKVAAWEGAEVDHHTVVE